MGNLGELGTECEWAEGVKLDQKHSRGSESSLWEHEWVWEDKFVHCHVGGSVLGANKFGRGRTEEMPGGVGWSGL